MLNMYPRCVLEGSLCLQCTLSRVSVIYFVGITLFVIKQGCGKPQMMDEQKVDTHVFRCVETEIIKKLSKLGYHRADIKICLIIVYQLKKLFHQKKDQLGKWTNIVYS